MWPSLERSSENRRRGRSAPRPCAGRLRAFTSRAKAVADFYKYRGKVGLDVALEALEAYLGRWGRSTDKLLEAAAVCRVANVIRPYIEALW